MAASSQERVREARSRRSLSELRAQIQSLPKAPELRLSSAGFDVIAELKLRSPAVGALGSRQDAWQSRVVAYAKAGAAAVSVLTEPTRFDGELSHLSQAAALLGPLGVPAMRKDFLVDPYQLAEARAAGAGGVLLIVRMLSKAQLAELLDAAAQFELFVLLEAFDEADLAVAEELLAARAGAAILVGVNCRDLQTLQVVSARFDTLSKHLPREWPAVAESGVDTAAEAQRMRKLGFRLALIGTALMRRDDPASLLQEIFAATRTVQS